MRQTARKMRALPFMISENQCNGRIEIALCHPSFQTTQVCVFNVIAELSYALSKWGAHASQRAAFGILPNAFCVAQSLQLGQRVAHDFRCFLDVRGRMRR
jgi:hypothetical protein